MLVMVGMLLGFLTSVLSGTLYFWPAATVLVLCLGYSTIRCVWLRLP